MEVEIYEVKPCESFVGPTADNGQQVWIQESVGAWAACAACHDLIEADRRDELAERSYNSASAPQGWEQIKRLIPKRELIGQFRVLHDQFLSHRLGPAVPVRTAA